MTVTKLEALTKTKYRVFLDDKPAFVLYTGELSKYSIQEGGKLPAQVYEDIMKEAVKKAKLKAMRLLEIMDRTESEIAGRLEKDGYPKKAADAAIAYVKSYGYVDDMRYALNFIDRNKISKSKPWIYSMLGKRGIDKETVSEAFEKAYGEGDGTEAIKNLIRKRKADILGISREELGKLYAYLARKGFAYEDIKRAFQELLDTEMKKV